MFGWRQRLARRWRPELRELDHIIDNDRYPLPPRIRTLTSIRDKQGRGFVV